MSEIKVEIREQKDAKGNLELLDGSVYRHQIVCEVCGEIRWVREADLQAGTVRKCKPCQAIAVKVKTREKTKARNRRKSQEKREAHARALAAAMAAKRDEIAARNQAANPASPASQPDPEEKPKGRGGRSSR